MNTNNNQEEKILTEKDLKNLQTKIVNDISEGDFYGIDEKIQQFHRAVLKIQRI